MSEIINVDNDNMPDLTTGTFLIDYYADFCGPCKVLAPILTEISLERDDVTILKVNIDRNVELTKKAGIRGIPAVFVFKDGAMITSKVGFSSKSAIVAMIDQAAA